MVEHSLGGPSLWASYISKEVFRTTVTLVTVLAEVVSYLLYILPPAAPAALMQQQKHFELAHSNNLFLNVHK